MSRDSLTASAFIPQAESTLAAFLSTVGDGGYDSLRRSQQERARLYVSDLRRMDAMLNVLITQYVDDPERLQRLIGLKECFSTVLDVYGADVPPDEGEEPYALGDRELAMAMPPSTPAHEQSTTASHASATSAAATSAAAASAPAPEPPPPEHENEDIVECTICYDEFQWGDMFELGCFHRFCKDCVKEYLTKKIEVADVVDIQCLDRSCKWSFDPDYIRDCVTEETFKKYERFSILASIRADPTARYCVKPGCEGVHLGMPEGPSQKIECPDCGTELCYACAAAWHEGNCEARKLTKEERKTQRWLRRKGIQNCPQCGVSTTRFGGCPTIDCPECGHTWEWNMKGGEETALEQWAFLYPRMVKGMAGAKEFREDGSSRTEQLVAGGFLGAATAVMLCPLLPVTIVAGPPALAIKGGRKVKHCFEDVAEYFRR